MMAAALNWWRGKARGEQAFWALLGLAVLAVLLWLAGRALAGGWTSMAADHRTAVERAARIEAKLAMLEAPQAPQALTPAAAAAGASGKTVRDLLADRAAEAGIDLTRNDATGDDRAAIAATSLRAPAVLAWLADLEQAGLVIDNLTLTPGVDGTVSLAADVRRQTAAD